MTVRINKRKLEQLARETPIMANRMLRAMATEIVGDIVVSFGTSPDGETYQRGSVTHVASSPGFPPNVDTGALRASIRWTEDTPLRLFIHDGVIYGKWLETGTDRMAPRPFFTPVIIEWQQRKFAAYARQFGLFNG